MREDLLRAAEAELEERRLRHEQEEQRRQQRIRDQEPEIAALMARRQGLLTQTLQSILQGQPAAADLPERMEKLNGDIRAALTDRGYPADYLAPIQDCPLCGDTGYAGEPVREMCTCLQQIYREKLRAAIGRAGNDRETFANYDPSLFPAEPEEGQPFSQRTMNAVIRNTCEQWADRWPDQQPRDLMLSGPSGVGKTFFLHAMAQRLVDRGCGVLLISAYSFLDIARRSFLDPEDGGMQDLIDAEVLMIDDLGSEPLMRNITVEQLFSLINERQRRNRATVISTNLNEAELRERYTERIMSRLTDRGSCSFITVLGRDIRTGRK